MPETRTKAASKPRGRPKKVPVPPPEPELEVPEVVPEVEMKVEPEPISVPEVKEVKEVKFEEEVPIEEVVKEEIKEFHQVHEAAKPVQIPLQLGVVLPPEKLMVVVVGSALVALLLDRTLAKVGL